MKMKISPVSTLDHDNFVSTILQHKFVAVLFDQFGWGHRGWELSRNYKRAAELLSSDYEPVILAKYDTKVEVLSNNDRPIIFAKVDVSEELNRFLAVHYNILSVPTIKIFKDGGKKVLDYSGCLRNAEELVECLKRISGPFPSEIKSEEDVNNLIRDDKIVIVGVFPEFSGPEYENFIEAAEELIWEYDFGLTLNAKNLPRGDPSVSGPVVRLFKPFDELFVDTKISDVDALVKFVKHNSTPEVTFYCDHPRVYVKNFFNFERKNDKAMLFNDRRKEGADALKSNYCEVAKKYRGQGIDFMLGDFKDSDRDAHRYFRVHHGSEYEHPFIIIRDPLKEVYVKDLDPDYDIEAWLEDYKAGRVTRYGKSEAVPLHNNEPVKVVVGYNFDEEIFGNEKNVLLELYRSRGTRDYIKLAPILDEVARYFENDGDILIAKLDETKNDIRSDGLDDIKTVEDPTLYLFSASGWNIQIYDGAICKEEIIEFIQEHRY